MEIGLYIADLLGEQDEVSVPGLGTFIKIRHSGTYDRMSNSFRPPYFQFSFKHNTSGDNLLSEYISMEHGLEISSAEDYIKEFASNILEQINEQNNAEIKALGILHRKDGSIHFEPSAELRNSGIFYGLKPQADTIPAFSSELVPKNGHNPSEEEMQTDEFYDEQAKSSGIKVFIFILLFFILLIGGSIALYFTNERVNIFFHNLASRVLNRNEIVTKPEADTSALKADTILKSADSLSVPADSGLKQPDTISKVSEETPRSLPPAPKVPVETDVNSEIIGYEIIGAAFARKSEADVYIKELASKGINAKIAENIPGKMLKISLGSFKDEKSAQEQLTQIQKEINKDAWIARIKQQKNSK